MKVGERCILLNGMDERGAPFTVELHPSGTPAKQTLGETKRPKRGPKPTWTKLINAQLVPLGALEGAIEGTAHNHEIW